MTATELRTLRRKLRLTQAELATALGVSMNTVARWEQGVHGVPPPVVLALTHLAQTHGGPRKSRSASA